MRTGHRSRAPLMLSRVAADVVMASHFAFLVFLSAGSLMAWRWPRLVAFHLPSVAWGVVSITVGLTCPLTPLEQQLRRSAGEQGYAGGFVDHYIEGVVYPEHYTPLLRVLIAIAVVVGYVGLARRSVRTQRLPPVARSHSFGRNVPGTTGRAALGSGTKDVHTLGIAPSRSRYHGRGKPCRAKL